MFAENANIFEDVKEKLGEISSEIDAERFIRSAPISAQTKPKTSVPPPTEAAKQAKQDTKIKKPPRVSLRLNNSQSPRPQLSVSLPIEPEKPPQKSKGKNTDRSQRMKDEKRIEFEKALEVYTKTARQKEILFKGLRRGNVCKQCLRVDENLDRDLVKCSGCCGEYNHLHLSHLPVNQNISFRHQSTMFTENVHPLPQSVQTMK